MSVARVSPLELRTGAVEDAADHGGAEGQLSTSVLSALIYADLFDYPLTLDEIARYQVGTRYPVEDIRLALHTAPDLAGHVGSNGGHYFLKNRGDLTHVRHERQATSGRLWSRAKMYTAWLARLPYVRMVAITGALAVHNVGTLQDIDLLVVAEPGRVWLCRRALVMWVRLARVLGDELCPNYIVAADSLRLDQRDFFTAHELAQMVPLVGRSIYHEMLGANDWALCYLPRGYDHAHNHAGVRGPSWVQRPAEKVLGTRSFDRWERWELGRLRRKLSPDLGAHAEIICSPAQCKGHTGLHRHRVMSRFRERFHEMGLADSIPPILRADFSDTAPL